MAFAEYLVMLMVVSICLEVQVLCDDPSSSGAELDKSDASSIPILASGKRQHNIMRFGKRPAGGHNLIHFGKKDGAPKPPQHSFLYFGKRDDGRAGLPNLFQYLQNPDNSYKRGHTIMRFGKRGGENHNFIRFGRRVDEEDYDGYYPEDDVQVPMEEDKRDGHSMLYFGKRGDGHSMLYFGKRTGHNMLSFGKRAHSMIHFGKREDDEDEEEYPEEEKRAHSMIHFGKRENDVEPDEEKRGSHSMIHFGKRDYGEVPIPFFWNPVASEKRQHNLLRFGKKTEGSRKGSHAMIHFGKRDEGEEKRAHSMIHFGKRSVDQNMDSVAFHNQSDKESQKSPNEVSRKKRQSGPDPLVSLLHYGSSEGLGDAADDDGVQQAILDSQGNFYHPDTILESVAYPEDDPGNLSTYTDYVQPDKKDGSKNVFLRFG